jgi:predicted nucleic acid-binding protein
MRLFLDANVLFTAAHNPEGRAAGLLALARQGTCRLLSSPHAVEEARRNLKLKYPAAGEVLERMLTDVAVGREAPPSVVAWALGQGLPPKDAPVLAAAVHARADVLVTGDRTHFGALYGRSLEGVLVLSPAEALARLTAS